MCTLVTSTQTLFSPEPLGRLVETRLLVHPFPQTGSPDPDNQVFLGMTMPQGAPFRVLLVGRLQGTRGFP